MSEIAFQADRNGSPEEGALTGVAMRIKVLLVDDETAFTDTLAQRLEMRNFDVAKAYSGEEAISLAEQTAFDVVVLDVHMPGLSGNETLQKLKDLSPLSQVIMLTGNATVELAISGMKLGAHDFLMKPADTEDLVKKINEACSIKKSHEDRIHKAEIDNLLNRRGW